ncbi:DUF3558 domain-containing protein [Streptomyces sp. NK15101]|uniref:DUF3558 domain-containing protein n=1 Tax=Streptomyces sp. NK15101 TaxID=2873261 RepID=UPI001CEDB88E|nr:DUF3558 domain-containing protein [Streptomyces sp. NK15101]
MQRKRYAPGRTGSTARTAVVLALGLGLGAGLTACSAGTPADDVAVDAKAGQAAAPVAPPGRYRTLFEPCGAVPQATLKVLLPGAAALPDAERDKAYRGVAAVTYDTDRRVGCTWKADTADTSHWLSLDVERVVSYDAAVSDDDRAQEVYVRKQVAAGIPVPTAPPTPTAAPTVPATGAPSAAGKPAAGSAALAGKAPSAGATPAGAPTGAPAGSPSGVPTGSASPGSGPAATGLGPRVLEGLGDVAYLDDALSAVGANGHQRAVSVVFRTSNVIVTVWYREQTTGSPEAPDSAELQEKARYLARQLAERLEE